MRRVSEITADRGPAVARITAKECQRSTPIVDRPTDWFLSMNARQLSKNVGNLFRLRPLPFRKESNGMALPKTDDRWNLWGGMEIFGVMLIRLGALWG